MNTKINAYNVYQDGTKLIGISDEVTLPDFDSLTDTLSGPGILGEVDEPLLGHFGASEIDVPFRTMDDQAFKLLAAGNAVDLTFRISTQAIEETNLSTDFMPSRIVIRGKSKGFSGGSLKQGQGTGSSVKVEILYFLYEINGAKRFELDKLNFVYKVNGVDLLEKVRSQC